MSFAAAEKPLEQFVETLVNFHKRTAEQGSCLFVRVGNNLFQVVHATLHVLQLCPEILKPFAQRLVLRENSHVDFAQLAQAAFKIAAAAVQLVSALVFSRHKTGRIGIFLLV